MSLEGHSFRDSKYNRRSFAQNVWTFRSFQRNSPEYLSRHLNYDTDVLRAFTGALEWMSQDMQMPFVYGSPRKDLLNGIL
jgi:hypothetical protein